MMQAESKRETLRFVPVINTLTPALIIAGFMAILSDVWADSPDVYQGADGSEWRLIWHDEFEGHALDESKWSSGLPWVGATGQYPGRHHNDKYASYIMNDEVKVADGKLLLSTRRRSVTAPNGQSFNYTQAMITTFGRFEHQYGYFEARVKLPTDAGPGMWPAFWTLADGWPPEMDICEVWTSTNRSHQGLAYLNEEGEVSWDDVNTYTPLPEGWRTYGMEWGPGYQFYNIDGQVTKRVYGSHVPDVAQYILLNSGIDAIDPPTDATRFPNTFAVDYVRVFERPDRPVIHNADFELDTQQPWEADGCAEFSSDSGIEGSQAVRLQGEGSRIEQEIFGLQKNTRYIVKAEARVEGNEVQACLGVKLHDIKPEIVTRTMSSEFSQIEAKFSTGEDSRTAIVFCSVDGDSGSVLFDEVSIELVEVDLQD